MSILLIPLLGLKTRLRYCLWSSPENENDSCLSIFVYLNITINNITEELEFQFNLLALQDDKVPADEVYYLRDFDKYEKRES